jgi:ABC-type multidrug transport system fused ATPase/permease subunit
MCGARGAPFPPKEPPVQLLARFVRELRPYAKTMIFVGVLTIVSAVLALQIPRLIGQLFNDLVENRPVALPLIFGELLAVSAASAAIGYSMSVTVTFLGQRFMLDMRRKLYAHLQTLSQGYFEKAQTGQTRFHHRQ